MHQTGTFPSPPSLTKLPGYSTTPYFKLAPAVKAKLASSEFKKTVDDYLAQEKRKKEKAKEREERRKNISRYQNVVAALGRKLIYEKGMKTAGAKKQYARPGVASKRISKGKKLKDGLINRGKSSGLRTSWTLGLCTPADKDTLSEDQLQEDLEDQLGEEMTNKHTYMDEYKKGKAGSPKAEKKCKMHWNLRKAMAKNKARWSEYEKEKEHEMESFLFDD